MLPLCDICIQFGWYCDHSNHAETDDEGEPTVDVDFGFEVVAPDLDQAIAGIGRIESGEVAGLETDLDGPGQEVAAIGGIIKAKNGATHRSPIVLFIVVAVVDPASRPMVVLSVLGIEIGISIRATAGTPSGVGHRDQLPLIVFVFGLGTLSIMLNHERDALRQPGVVQFSILESHRL